MTSVSNGGRVDCLDGLRGLAALWSTGWPCSYSDRIFAANHWRPGSRCRPFHHAVWLPDGLSLSAQKEREPWEASNTWITFWVRRYFRIAPLYYVMLVAALTLGPFIYDSRMVIDGFNGVEPQLASRYLDSSLTNYLAHLTFLFGFSPDYAFRTALPDWSIGLEMQFYAALPFIMIIVGRIGWIKGIVGASFAGIVISYALNRLGISFPMPTFLPLKMHIFAAGMLLAGALRTDKRRAYQFAVIAILLVLAPLGGGKDLMHQFVRIALVLIFFAFIHTHRLPETLAKPLRPMGAWLGNRFFHGLGELSFGAYLIHLMVMQPVIAYLIKTTDVSDPVRWALSSSSPCRSSTVSPGSVTT